MTDHPILFSAPMVRRLIDEVKRPGTGKTQTRRVLKPVAPIDDAIEWKPETVVGVSYPRDGWWTARVPEGWTGGANVKYTAGDHLWVRETWNTIPDALSECQGPADIGYAASADEAEWAISTWRPSIHMPRWASRLTLTVTDVRVERLQDISEADAIAEGINWSQRTEGYSYDPDDGGPGYHGSDPRESFFKLWDSINGSDGPKSWSANPWVVAIRFTPELRNIDAPTRVVSDPNPPAIAWCNTHHRPGSQCTSVTAKPEDGGPS